MAFRGGVASAAVVDTRYDPAGAGVRVYQDNSVPAAPLGVVEFTDGFFGDTPARLTQHAAANTRAQNASASGGVTLAGGSYAGTTAPTLTLDVVDNGDGSTSRVASITGADRFTVNGLPLGVGPLPSIARTAGVNGLPVNAGAVVAPTGAALSLPVLPAGTLVAVDLAAQFYAEGSGIPQSCSAGINATGATIISGASTPGLSMTSIVVGTHALSVWQVTSSTVAAAFSSTYKGGPNSNRCILQREDWTVWLP